MSTPDVLALAKSLNDAVILDDEQSAVELFVACEQAGGQSVQELSLLRVSLAATQSEKEPRSCIRCFL